MVKKKVSLPQNAGRPKSAKQEAIDYVQQTDNTENIISSTTSETQEDELILTDDDHVVASSKTEVISSKDEQQRLQSLEQVIESNLKTFYQVGLALKEIRDSHLYHLQGYSNFDDYCKERWEMRRAHAYRLIDSSLVMSALSPIGDKLLPVNESQIRPLIKLSPEEQRQAWEKVIEVAPVIENKPRITTKLVEKIVSEVTGKNDRSKKSQREAKKKFNYHLPMDEETDDALNEVFYKMRKLVGKEHKGKITKELVIEVMLRVALKELEQNNKDSVIKEVLKEIEGEELDQDGIEL